MDISHPHVVFTNPAVGFSYIIVFRVLKLDLILTESQEIHLPGTKLIDEALSKKINASPNLYLPSLVGLGYM